MKPRGRRFGWLILMVGLFASACGGDDETPATPDVRNDAGLTDRGADTRGEAARDTSSQEAADDAPIDGTTDASDAATPDVSSGEASPEASPDAGADTSSSGGDASDGALPTDAGAEPSAMEAGTESGATDAGSDTGAVAEAAADAADTTSEGSQDATVEPAVDASVDADASTVDVAADTAEAAPDSGVGDEGGDAAEGSAPELVHWKIEARPPECSTESNQVSCGEVGVFQVYVQAGCPTSISEVYMWFPTGSLPTVGQHVIRPAANIGDAYAVTGNEVAMRIIHFQVPTQRWWAQSGTVDVQANGNRPTFQFTGVSAFLESNHATTTTLEGFLICAP